MRTEQQTTNLRNWVEVLHSGKYQQVSGVLRTKENRFCVWGVACDLVNPSLWDLQAGRSFYRYSSDGFFTKMFPPEEIYKDHFGLNEDETSILMDMNDAGRSFSEIADYIEDHLIENHLI